MDNRRSSSASKYGFTLIEVLLSLAITLIIVLNAATIIQITTSSKKIDSLLANHQLGAKQISQTLHTAKFQSISNELIFMDEKQETCTISLDKGRVVKQPGFIIYMHDVEELSFFEENQKVYMQVIHNKQEKVYLIGTNYYQEEDKENEENTKPEG